MRMKVGKEVVLAIPDLQLPFEHQDALLFLKHIRDKYRPTIVVQMGDFMDLHAVSEYIPDPNGMSPGHEVSEAVKRAYAYYEEFPNVMVLTSNHDIRAYKKAKKIGIPTQFMRDYHEWMEFPTGWSMFEELEIDGIIYEHGEGVSGKNGALRAAEKNMQSTVIGHLHSFAGIQYYNSSRRCIWGMNVGCLIDANGYAFAYGRKHKNKPTLGCGIIKNGIPFFIPMITNEDGRWIGPSLEGHQNKSEIIKIPAFLSKTRQGR